MGIDDAQKHTSAHLQILVLCQPSLRNESASVAVVLHGLGHCSKYCRERFLFPDVSQGKIVIDHAQFALIREVD
jgi:ABC-type hemin transport system ATPase subunit